MRNSITPIATPIRSTLALPCVSLLLAVAPLLLSSAPVIGQAPSLGSASAFAVLGASTVTNAGASVIGGDVGVAPGTAITGFPPGTLTGTLHAGDAVATQAQADVTLAYNAITAGVCTTTLTGQDLGGMTLTPGIYCFAAAAQLTGTVTFDAQGNGAAVFIVKTGSTLTTAAASAVAFVNGAKAGNLFWQVGSSATLGAATNFAGNLIALASITAGAGSSVSGRLLARTAAVTLNTNAVALPSSATTSSTGPGCGTPAPILSAVGLPTIDNAAFALATISAPNQTVFLMSAFGPANLLLAPGCFLRLDNSMLGSGWYTASGVGATSFAVPVPNSPALDGMQVYWQAASSVAGGPWLGNFAISNGLLTVLGV